jgi:general secretion pathway protein D
MTCIIKSSARRAAARLNLVVLSSALGVVVVAPDGRGLGAGAAHAETVFAQTVPGTTGASPSPSGSPPSPGTARRFGGKPPRSPFLRGAPVRGSKLSPAASPTTSAAGSQAGSDSAATTAAGSTTGAIVDAQSEREYNSCHQFPANRRIVKLNMKPDTELGDLISWISSITCKQFLLPGTIPGNSKKVTIVAPQLITPEEAYRLFLAALDSVGLTVQESGKFYRIIETPKARSNAPLSASDGESYPGDRYLTRLVRVENSDPNEIAQVLLRLKSEQGDIIVYAPQGALIITDLSSSIDRMLKVVDELDQPTQGEKVWMIRMKNTSATDMAQKLAEIVKVEQPGAKRVGAPPSPLSAGKSRSAADLAAEMTVSKLIPDERSNQLIVVAGERAYARLISLIRKLDVSVEGGDARIHVYYCENANCDELGQTLSAVTGVAVAGGGATRARRGAAAPATPGAPTGPSSQLQFLFEGDVRVSFDRPTNSLIILSSLKDYQSLRRVIEKLDSPRKQIFVEAMVMEVSLDKTRTLGASFHGGAAAVSIFGQQSLVLGGLNASKTLAPGGLLAQGGDTLLGLAAGIIGPPIPNGAQTLGLPASVSSDIPSFGVLISALQQNNDVNVLSTPHLLIMNNEDGEISVGQNLPFQGASVAGSAAGGLGALGGLGFATPVQRTDVALKMKLTPHVNEHDMIRLEVDQEIQDILSPNFNGLGPATSKRTAKTTVVARDQQTIVIGGLMSDRVVERVTKIPFLGDIPILGFFFRTSIKTVQKTNILIALTPYVISDQSDLRRVLEKKLKERREFVERFGSQDVVTPEAQIDYRRKRGMLEEINRAAKELSDEDLEIQKLRERTLEESGPMDLPPIPHGPTFDDAPAPSAAPSGGGGRPTQGQPSGSPGALVPPPFPTNSVPAPGQTAPGDFAPTPGPAPASPPGPAPTSPSAPTSPPGAESGESPSPTGPAAGNLPPGSLTSAAPPAPVRVE